MYGIVFHRPSGTQAYVEARPITGTSLGYGYYARESDYTKKVDVVAHVGSFDLLRLMPCSVPMSEPQ